MLELLCSGLNRTSELLPFSFVLRVLGTLVSHLEAVVCSGGVGV